MIIQSADSTGKVHILGFGRIVTKGDNPPIGYIKTTNTHAAIFTVTVGCTSYQDEKGKYRYNFQNVPCIVYANSGNKECMAIVDKFKKNQQIFFGGTLHKHFVYDEKTRLNKEYKQVWIEFAFPYIEFMIPIVKAFLGDDVDLSKVLSKRALKNKTEKDNETSVIIGNNKVKENNGKYKF